MLAFKIALRYLFAKKSHRAVNVISVISLVGVAVATMAIVVVLSVFNGFTDLASGHLSKIDPELKVVPDEGKVFAGADSIAVALERLPEVKSAMPTLQERALVIAFDKQYPVIFKGVDPDKYLQITDFESTIIDGVYSSDSMADSVGAMLLAVGPAVNLRLRPSPYPVADIYVPRRTGRINPANPAAAYVNRQYAVCGVFRVDQPEYDADYVVITLDEARRLLAYTDEASAIEIAVAPGADIADAAAKISAVLGSAFTVQTRMQQQADAFKMISIEKWVTFLMLIFILLIASFNIVSTLSLLVIEKRSNMSTLRALGASHSMITKVFMLEGWLITCIGGVLGALVGVLLSLLQQYFGLIKLSADPSALTIDVYPVRVLPTDVLVVILSVAIVGFVISQISRVFTKSIQ